MSKNNNSQRSDTALERIRAIRRNPSYDITLVEDTLIDALRIDIGLIVRQRSHPTQQQKDSLFAYFRELEETIKDRQIQIKELKESKERAHHAAYTATRDCCNLHCKFETLKAILNSVTDKECKHLYEPRSPSPGHYEVD